MPALTLATLVFLQQAVQASLLPPSITIQPPTPDRPIAMVNGKPILANDILPFLWEWRGQEVLQEFISYQIALEEATKEGVSVADSDVQSRLDSLITETRKQMPPGKTLEQLMAEEGSSPSRLFLRLKTEMLLDKVVLKKFVPSEYYRVSTIIIRTPSQDGAALKESIRKAELAYTEATSRGWKSAVKAYGDDEAVKSDGLLGWRHQGAFPESVRAQLKDLKVGGVSRPAQTSNGIQIFRLEDRGDSAPTSQLKELEATYTRSARAQLVRRLRSETKVERLLPSAGGGKTSGQTGGSSR